MKRITITIDNDLKTDLEKIGNRFNISSVCRKALREKIASVASNKPRRLIPKDLGRRLLMEKKSILMDWSHWARIDAEKLFIAGEITFDDACRIVESEFVPKIVQKTFKDRYIIPDLRVKKYDDLFVRSIHFLTYMKAFRVVMQEFLDAVE